MPIQYITLHSFEGDAAQNQLSFQAGATILAKDEATVDTMMGWGWGKLEATNQSGWFPSSHAVKAPTQAPPPLPVAEAVPVIVPVPTPPQLTSATPLGEVMTPMPASLPPPVPSSEKQEDDDFFGPIMGGTSPEPLGRPPSPPPPQPEAETIHIKVNVPTESNNKDLLGSLRSSVAVGASKTGSALSSAASKTGRVFASLTNQTVSSNTTQCTKAEPPPSTSQADQDGWFKKGIKNSSLFASRKPNAVTQTTQTTTTGSWFGPRMTTTTTVVERPKRLNVAGRVGTYATFGAAMNLAHGNVLGAARSGAVAATAFAIEGNHNED